MFPPLLGEVEKEPDTLMDEVHITSLASTAHVPPPGIQPVSPPKPKEDPKPNPHQAKIPYPSRLNKTKLLDKNDIQVLKKLEDPGKFLIPCVLQDLEVDLRVPIILGRPFLRTTKALVDMYKEKLTLRVGNEEVVSFPSSPLVETSDSSLEEFADELALLDPFPTRNEDDNFDPETDIDITDPILERFTDEPALVYSFPPEDEDDDLFDFENDNDE
ncbi:hypothetical protein Tco_1160857 [Tanacetum coccineum]